MSAISADHFPQRPETRQANADKLCDGLFAAVTLLAAFTRNGRPYFPAMDDPAWEQVSLALPGMEKLLRENHPSVPAFALEDAVSFHRIRQVAVRASTGEWLGSADGDGNSFHDLLSKLPYKDDVRIIRRGEPGFAKAALLGLGVESA